jgi:hypothetical protein
VSVSRPGRWVPGLAAAEGIRSLAHRQQVRVALVVALGFVLVAGGGVAAGLMIWREAPASGGALAAGSSGSSVASLRTVNGRLDTSTRQAMVGPATMLLPDDPYALDTEPKRVAGVIDVVFLANATVHSDYNGRDDWLATVALVLVSQELDRSADLEQAGNTAMRQLGKRFFGHHPTWIRNMRFADRSVDSHPGMDVTAEIHYRITGLASRYDRVTMRLVRTDDGALVAAISSIPDDASPSVAELAAHSLESLTMR